MPDVHPLIFVHSHGLGPWPCHGCQGPVVIEKLIVHHIDEDHSNNDPANLAAVHRPCHARLHHIGRKRPPLSAEHRQHIGDASRGHVTSEETKRKISAAMAGKPKTEEHRQNIAIGRRKVPS